MDAVALEDDRLLGDIRARVRQALTSSSAFNALPAAKRSEIAHDTVRAFHYILGGADGRSRPAGVELAGNSSSFAPLAQAQAGAPVPGGRFTVPAPPPIGEAARQGGSAMANLVQEVDFPSFVGGLVDGVFNSIVTSSIKQMEAYAELVKNVSKSVDQYMKDNVTEGDARDYLVQKYPEHLEMDYTQEAPKVKPREGADESNLPDFFADLGLKVPMSGLDQDSAEQQLVPAARQRIAMDRQQMLATMVMMGVNRLVVTNGTIEASCLFRLDTRDTRTRNRTNTSGGTTTSGSHDEWGGKGDSHWEGENKGGWFSNKSSKYSGNSSWYNGHTRDSSATFSVSTVDTNKNEEEIKLHAELAGKVKLNFKSDYFPMERMVDALQINQIREKTPSAAPAPAVPLPAPPPLPAMPALPPVPGLPAPGR
ncbi:hypothetical protein H8N03_16225 [Ramlibacter sp. USB13]|uniref:Uncharacterized protein n=1 Tax=Ramlibacter cellulosilyticus TaxID=2764187 RepID=A0A923SC16_9BURK|nr:hypothetical protein [Ramlibacter cellulosilyticus]MBC5784496.1 hypothetical protein [Ramlibacter cellulosilyticus]